MDEPASRDIASIVERAKKGDNEAFSYLYEAYFTPLYRYVYFRVKSKSDAEDLVQDVFLKAYSSFSRYRHSGNSPLAYFYTIARNTVIDYYKKKKFATVTEDDELVNIPAVARTQEEESMLLEEGAAIREKVSLLPDNQRDVILLRFIDELSTKEISGLLGKSEAAVRQLQSEGLKSLRVLMKKNE